MKIKYLHVTFVALIALSIFSGMFVGDVSQARAQSSRVWSDPINLSNSGATSNPVLVVDQSGKIHALWVDQFDGYKYAQSTDGKQWSLAEKVKFPFDTKGALPVLVAAPRGFIHLFWQNVEKELIYAQAHSDNLKDPLAWGFQLAMSQNVLTYNVAVDPQGILHLAYIRNKNGLLGPAGVYYARSLDEGRSWSIEKLLYESQYFRTTKPEIAHIRVVVPDNAGDGRVYVTWDNTSLKRIFTSTSADSGLNWSGAVQMKGPEDTGGYDMPFNGEMSLNGEKTLLLWEVGEPGANQCNLYGQWSQDNGATWSEPDIILSNRSICPTGIDFLINEDDSLVALLSYAQGSPSLIAWNGTAWSEPQIQDELSFFSNPVTSETLLLGCQYHSVSGDQLFLIGCDLGSGGDVWVMSRTIVPITDWAFSASLWSLPTLLASTTQKIPFLTYTADGDYLHAVWSQSPLTSDSEWEEAIYYSRWNGSQWSPALDVVYGLNGTAGDLTVAANGKDRLLLVWSDKNNGDLLFSWANSGKANSPAEWENPHDLPSLSQWTSSPDILVDASGTIVVVYAVPINEKRGIYMIRSVDNGITWSTPVTIFDAEAAGWVMVDHPKVALGGDGRLHVLFTNYSGLSNQPDGLNYLQSSDGGLAWSAPEVVSEGSVIWSEITGYDGNTIHRIWQQDDGSVVASLDQESTDGGVTWGKTVNITGVSNDAIPVALVSNNLGELHFIQMIEEDTPSYLSEDNLNIHDWRWNGTQWESQPSQEISIKGDRARYSIAAGISSKGYISVSLLAEYYDREGELKNEIYNIGRSLSDFNVNTPPYSAVIANSASETTSTVPIDIQPNSSPEPTPYPDISDSAPSALGKNLVGILLVLLVIGLTVFIFLRRVKRVGQG